MSKHRKESVVLFVGKAVILLASALLFGLLGLLWVLDIVGSK